MGYSNYCHRIKMNDTQWATYVDHMVILYNKAGLMLTGVDSDEESFLKKVAKGPVASKASKASKAVVKFSGMDTCEAFVMHPGYRRSRYGNPAFWSCKTCRMAYDFIVKCALILLAEAGGASSIGCDDIGDIDDIDDIDDIVGNDWSTAMSWLSKQVGLPTKYPLAKEALANYLQGK